MAPQEVIDKVKDLLQRIVNSDEMGIQRDLNDDPFEPVCIEILGNMYELHDAEVIGQHEYHTGQDEEEYCDIKLQCYREDDFGAFGESKIYEFIVSIEWLKGYMESLEEYLHSYDEKPNTLSHQYFEKAKGYINNLEMYEAYRSIGYALDESDEDVQQAIVNLKNQVYLGEKAKLSLRLLQEEQE